MPMVLKMLGLIGIGVLLMLLIVISSQCRPANDVSAT
jgi:hypothetical protein